MAVIVKKLQQSSGGPALLYAALAIIAGSLIGLLITGLNNPFFILLLAGGLVVVVATVASVEIGLLLFVFLTYTRFSDIAIDFYNAPSVAKFFVGLLVIAILIRWAILGERPMGWQVPAIVLGLYGLIGFLSLMYARNSESVINTLSNYVKDALITVVIVVLLRKAPTFRHVIWTLLVAGIFLGSLSVFQYLTGTFDNNYGGFARAELKGIAGEQDGYRLTGPIGDANFFAQIMIVLIPIALERMIHERKPILKLLAGLAALISILTVIFTFSRGGFLAAAVALLIFFLVYPPRPQYLVILIGIGIAVFSFVPSSYFDRILTLQGLLPDQFGRIDIRTDNSIQGRASQNLTAWNILRQHPIVGIGLDNFEVRYPEFSKEIGLAPSASNKSLHNLYLEVATESGIVGLSIFLLMIWLAFRSLLNARSALLDTPGVRDYAHIATGLLIGFAGYLVAALFIHAAFPRYFYLLVGIAFAMPAIVEHARSTLKNPVLRA